jgi:hypothetical protein
MRRRGRRTRPPSFERPVWRVRDHDFAARRLLRFRRPRMIIDYAVEIPSADGDQRSAYEKVLHVHRFGSKAQAIWRSTLLGKSGLPTHLSDRNRVFIAGRDPSELAAKFFGTQAIDRLLEKTPRNRSDEQRPDSEQHQA